MRTASLLLLCLPLSARADAPAPPVEVRLQDREQEAALLHRRVDLSQVQRWLPAGKGWQPLGRPRARVLVLNLWSVTCAPCREEFPLFRSMAQGWREQPEVQFLFISETPSKKETLDFWQGFWAPPGGAPAGLAISTDESALRKPLGIGIQPLTLLLDEQLVVRQAFIGSVKGRDRDLGAAIVRLSKSLSP